MLRSMTRSLARILVGIVLPLLLAFAATGASAQMTRGQLARLLHASAVAPPSVTADATLTTAVAGGQVGVAITANPPTVSYGVITGPSWQYIDGTAVPGASGTTYTPVSGDVGLKIRSAYSIAGNGYVIGPVYSAALGPIAAAVGPNAPNIAAQSLTFGANTLVGAGAVAPTNTGGAPTSASCTGTRASDFNVSASGVFTAAVTPLQASYSLSCTFGNSHGSVSPTITIATTPNAYTVASESEIQAVQALAVATLSGKTILVRPGTYHWATGDTTGWFRNKVYTSEVILTSADPNNRATFILGCDDNTSSKCTQLRGTANLTFYRLKFYAPFTPAWLDANGHNTAAQANGPAMTLIGGTNFKLQESELSSNWKELVDQYGFTTLSQESAGGCPTSTGGNWVECYTWRGIISAGSSNLGGTLQVLDNVLHGSWRLFQTANGASSVIIRGNEFYDFSGDAINVIGDTPTYTEVSYNIFRDVLSYNTSIVHTDAGQFVPGINKADISHVRVFGNLTKAGRTDAYYFLSGISTLLQAHFMEDIQPHNYVDAWVFGNFFDIGATHGVSLYDAVYSCVCGNTGVMNPSFGVASSNAPQTRILRQTPATATPHDNELADNLSYASALENAADGVKVNNLVADPSAGSGATAYSTLFTGPTFEPQTLADTLAAYTPKAGSAALTASPMKIGALGTGYFDPRAAGPLGAAYRVWDYPRLNAVDPFAFVDATAQPSNTLVTSAGVRINNITRSDGAASSFGALVRVSGGIAPAFGIFSDAACTVPVVNWTSAPAEAMDAANGNYVCVRDTSSPSTATTTNILVRVGGQYDTWSITTN